MPALPHSHFENRSKKKDKTPVTNSNISDLCYYAGCYGEKEGCHLVGFLCLGKNLVVAFHSDTVLVVEQKNLC